MTFLDVGRGYGMYRLVIWSGRASAGVFGTGARAADAPKRNPPNTQKLGGGPKGSRVFPRCDSHLAGEHSVLPAGAAGGKVQVGFSRVLSFAANYPYYRKTTTSKTPLTTFL